MSDGPERLLSELYRATAREEPPASLDSVILAEARKASPKPAWTWSCGWGAPLAAAAVVVLSVTLVIAVHENENAARMESAPAQRGGEEHGASDAVAQRVEPQPKAQDDQHYARASGTRQEEAAAKPQDRATKRDRKAPAASVDEQSAKALASTRANAPEPERAASAHPAVPSPPAAPAAAAPEAREHGPVEPATAPPVAAARALGKVGAEDEAVLERRRPDAAEVDQAIPKAKQGAANDALRRREAVAVDDRTAPEAWIERISKLRDEGRHAEVRESLAAFKKRFPDYPLPEALRSY